jgi:hypothetical protein
LFFIFVSYATRKNLQAHWHIPCHYLFQEGKVSEVKCIHLLLSAMLLTVATVWARASAQGIEQALVSTGVECCVKALRARTKALSIINFL